MGYKERTIQNLEIIKSDLENNLIFIKGSVPGSKNTTVLIQTPSKIINRQTTLEKSKKVFSEVAVGDKKVDKSKTKSTKENKTVAEKKPDTPKKEDKK